MIRSIYVVNITNQLSNFLEYHKLTKFINKKDIKGYYKELKDFLESILNQNIVDFANSKFNMVLNMESYIDYVVDIMGIPDYIQYDEISKFVVIINDIANQIIDKIGIDNLYNIYTIDVIEITKNYVVLQEYSNEHKKNAV